MRYHRQKDRVLYVVSSSASHRAVAVCNKGSWNQEYGFSKPEKRRDILPSAKGGCYPPRPRGVLWRRKAWTSNHHIKKMPQDNNVPCAPRNTTSFIMRYSKMGITAPLMSPATPLLQTPVVSPMPWPQESLGDGQAENDFKVDAYGSMKGCIRLRDKIASDQCAELMSGSSQNVDSDCGGRTNRPANSLQKLEERLDHDLQRFEILQYNYRARNRVGTTTMEDQEMHIASLEEENSLLQQRLMHAQQELAELRRRLSRQELTEACRDESTGHGSCAC